MTYAVGSAAISIVAPATSATIACRHHFRSHSRILRLLVVLVTFQILLLLPVQILGACQISGVIQKVNVPELAIFQLLILAAVAITTRLLPNSRPVGSKWEPAKLQGRRLPRVIIVSGAMLLLSHLVFVINLLTSYPVGWDGLVYHLPLSLRWLQDGSLRIPASRTWSFSMPGNTEIGMMLLLATGRQALAPLFNSLSLIVLALAIYLIARKCSGDVIASFVAMLILLTVPLFQFQAYSAYVDLAGTAFLMAAVALFLHRYEEQTSADGQVVWSWRTVAISGMACGIAIGTKPVFYLYAAVFLLTALIVLVRGRSYHGKPLIFVVLVLGLSSALPSAFWFWRAFHATGNPVYPLKVSVAGHTIFQGYRSSEITPMDIVRTRTSSPLGWLSYPWTEEISSRGVLLPPYSLDTGLGGAFATFVPLGLAFCLYLCLKRAANHNAVVLLLTWLVMLGVWWFALRHYPRFGMPLWALGCALATPLLGRFCRSDLKVFPWLLVCSLLATCSILALSPLHEMLARFRSGNWTRSGYYDYPAFIDQLPEGSRVLNKASKFNFILAGNNLTTRVVPEFESPADVNTKYLADQRIDYVVESSEVEDHFLDLRAAGGKLVYEGWLPIGESGRRREWRVWRISPPPGRP